MPRYFFHAAGPSAYTDRDGIDLVDDDAAWSMAIVSMAELLKDLDGRMPDRVEIGNSVTGIDGQVLVSLRFTGERHARAR